MIIKHHMLPLTRNFEIGFNFDDVYILARYYKHRADHPLLRPSSPSKVSFMNNILVLGLDCQLTSNESLQDKLKRI